MSHAIFHEFTYFPCFDSYEPDLNCHWTVTGPPDKIIKMRFTSFNLEMRQNDTHQSCWDYVEVRNGDVPFSPQVGVFCGATAPPDFLSSRDHLWVKFFTDSDNSAPGFSAVFTAEDPVCGSLVPLNATNITQVTCIEPLNSIVGLIHFFRDTL